MNMPLTIAVLREPTDDQIEQLVQLCLRAYNAGEETWDISVKTLAGGNTAGLTSFFRASIRAAVGGEIHVVSEDGDTSGPIRGLALWQPPGVEAFSTPQQQTILQEFVSQLSPEAKEWHKNTYRTGFARLTERALGPRGKLKSWYLSLLAVEPEYQRRGAAKALITAVESKANGAALTLAATNELNVHIYKRLGFEVRGSMVMQGQFGEFPVFVLALGK
ncbi:hypothetical protein C8F01DRAFT_434071 [Mycena amicta]|nr:hypothetical protein C8F01DRAFT_434071 [Mycena amicta]